MLERIKVIVDYAQYRQEIDRNVVLVKNFNLGRNNQVLSGWDLSLCSNIMVEKVSGKMMLRPQVLDPAWRTTTSGIYARLGKTDFTFNNASKWEDNATNVKVTGDKYITGHDLADEGFKTNTTFAKNQGIMLGFFAYNAGDEDMPFLHFGWSTDGTYNTGIWGKVSSSGEVRLYKDADELAVYKISGTTSQQLDANAFIALTLFPVANNQLVCLASTGAGFEHVFEHIEVLPGEDPVITPAGKFWVYFPGSSRKASVQVVPLVYPSSGTAISYPISLARIPQTGQGTAECDVIKDGATVTGIMVEEDDTATELVADGIVRRGRLKLTLSTASSTRTPVVYAAIGGYPSTIGYLNDEEELDISDYVSDITLNVSEGNGVSAELTLCRIADLETNLGMTNIYTMSNRPVKLVWGDQILFEGRVVGPSAVENGSNPNATKVTWPLKDPWNVLEKYFFRDMVPLNGLDFSAVIRWIVRQAGVPDDLIDVGEAGIILGEGQAPQGDEWTIIIEAGDTAKEVIERLFEAYAGNWFYDFAPVDGVIKFLARDPEDMSSTPVWTFYEKYEDGVLAAVADTWSSVEARIVARAYTYRSSKPSMIPAEGNELHITGIDAVSGRLIQVVRVDYSARDLTLLPSERALSWTGDPDNLGSFIPELNSWAVLTDALRKLWPRVSRPRYMCEFNSDLVKIESGRILWRGDVVTLENRGDWRITAMSFSLVKDADPDATDRGKLWCVRPVTYTAEKLVDADVSVAHRSFTYNIEQLLRERANSLLYVKKWRRGYSKYQQESIMEIREIVD